MNVVMQNDGDFMDENHSTAYVGRRKLTGGPHKRGRLQILDLNIVLE